MPLPLTRLVSELHRLAESPALDADLLERFARRRDLAAFGTLVERHGPMVLRLCRRVLGDAHTAEDAFQATAIEPGTVAQFVQISGEGAKEVNLGYPFAVSLARRTGFARTPLSQIAFASRIEAESENPLWRWPDGILTSAQGGGDAMRRWCGTVATQLGTKIQEHAQAKGCDK
jgi:hypothetical protein